MKPPQVWGFSGSWGSSNSHSWGPNHGEMLRAQMLRTLVGQPSTPRPHPHTLLGVSGWCRCSQDISRDFFWLLSPSSQGWGIQWGSCEALRASQARTIKEQHPGGSTSTRGFLNFAPAWGALTPGSWLPALLLAVNKYLLFSKCQQRAGRKVGSMGVCTQQPWPWTPPLHSDTGGSSTVRAPVSWVEIQVI